MSQTDFLDFYGPVAPPLEDAPPNVVTADVLLACLEAAPPLSSPHKNGWRNEHFVEMAKDPACAAAMARMLTAVVTGDVP